jgi:hypothetical protein
VLLSHNTSTHTEEHKCENRICENAKYFGRSVKCVCELGFLLALLIKIFIQTDFLVQTFSHNFDSHLSILWCLFPIGRTFVVNCLEQGNNSSSWYHVLWRNYFLVFYMICVLGDQDQNYLVPMCDCCYVVFYPFCCESYWYKCYAWKYKLNLNPWGQLSSCLVGSLKLLLPQTYTILVPSRHERNFITSITSQTT